MNRLRSLVLVPLRSRLVWKQKPNKLQLVEHHDGPTAPFDNMPFSIHNRYAATAVFSVFFGLGLWAPFLLLWYMMAKRTL